MAGMIDETLVQGAVWLGILVAAIALLRIIFHATNTFLTSQLGRFAAWRPVFADRYRASPTVVRLQRSAPRLVAFLHARVDTGRPSGWPLSVAIALIFGLSLWFVEIAEDVVREPAMQALDDTILAALSGAASGPVVYLFYWVTGLGGNAALASAAVVAWAILWACGKKHLVLGLWATALGSQGTLWLAKFTFDRARPEFLTDVTASSPSFPSGHTTGAMAIYGFIGYAVASLSTNPRSRSEIVFWTSLAIAMVGLSRIALHVHYPSDVLGGFLVGGLWLVVGIVVARWRLERHGRARETTGSTESGFATTTFRNRRRDADAGDISTAPPR